MGQYLRHLPCFSMGYNPLWPALYWDPQMTVCFPEDPRLCCFCCHCHHCLQANHTQWGPQGELQGDTSLHPRKAQTAHPMLSTSELPHECSLATHQQADTCPVQLKEVALFHPMFGLLLHLFSFLLSHSFGTLWAWGTGAAVTPASCGLLSLVSHSNPPIWEPKAFPFSRKNEDSPYEPICMGPYSPRDNFCKIIQISWTFERKFLLDWLMLFICYIIPLFKNPQAVLVCKNKLLWLTLKTLYSDCTLPSTLPSRTPQSELAAHHSLLKPLSPSYFLMCFPPPHLPLAKPFSSTAKPF